MISTRCTYEAIVECLETISSNNWDIKSVTEAHGILHANTGISDSFLVAFQTNLFIFGYTKGLSVLLQGSECDILTAHEEVEGINELRSIRDESEMVFTGVY